MKNEFYHFQNLFQFFTIEVKVVSIDTISGLVNQIIEFRNTTQALFNFINSIKVGKPTMPAGTQRPQQIVLDCSELLFHGDTVGAQDSTFLRFETIFVCVRSRALLGNYCDWPI